ncbi:MAG: cell division protein SepF [Peptostreptococcaceae bacterium]
MGDGILSKIKGIKEWITEEEEVEDGYEEVEEVEDMYEEAEDQYSSISSSKTAKIVNLHTSSQMKVVIVEPKKYDEVTTIADHLKQKRAVIVNLEGMNDQATRNSIFQFMNGAVYVLDGDIQKVSKAIFILAPNNVNIDASLKKELESKTLFPWQNK